MGIDKQPNPFAATKIEGGGKISVATTPVLIDFSIPVNSITISADADNAVKLYIGKSNITSAGANAIGYLSAGDIFSADYDLSTPLYIVAESAGQYFWKCGSK